MPHFSAVIEKEATVGVLSNTCVLRLNFSCLPSFRAHSMQATRQFEPTREPLLVVLQTTLMVKIGNAQMEFDAPPEFTAVDHSENIFDLKCST